MDILQNAKINRLGLRNINHISGNLLENTKTTFNIDNNSLAPFNTQIHSEFDENGYLIILTMANGIKHQNQDIFSIFDIDCVKIVNTTFTSFDNDVIKSGLLTDLHDTNKKIFFGLLKEDFLKTLNPIY